MQHIVNDETEPRPPAAFSVARNLETFAGQRWQDHVQRVPHHDQPSAAARPKEASAKRLWKQEAAAAAATAASAATAAAAGGGGGGGR